MFEHMKNYELLLAKINNWIKPGGKVHPLSHMYCVVFIECVVGVAAAYAASEKRSCDVALLP